MQKVTFTVNMIGTDSIEIIPSDGVLDDSIYNINLDGIKSLDGKFEVPKQTLTVYTDVTPAYATIKDVRSLLNGVDISDDIILQNIRAASKFLMFIEGVTVIAVETFEENQYVRFKAASESLLSFYMGRAATGGRKSQIGDVSSEEGNKLSDISDLLKYLDGKVKEYQDYVRGFGIEGRVRPWSTTRAKSANPQMSPLGIDYSRGV